MFLEIQLGAIKTMVFDTSEKWISRQTK